MHAASSSSSSSSGSGSTSALSSDTPTTQSIKWFDISKPTATESFASKTALQNQNFWKGFVKSVSIGTAVIGGTTALALAVDGKKALSLRAYKALIATEAWYLIYNALAKIRETDTHFSKIMRNVRESKKNFLADRNKIHDTAINALNRTNVDANNTLIDALDITAKATEESSANIRLLYLPNRVINIHIKVSTQLPETEQKLKNVVSRNIAGARIHLEKLFQIREALQTSIDYNQRIKSDFDTVKNAYNRPQPKQEDRGDHYDINVFKGCFDSNGQLDLNLYIIKRRKRENKGTYHGKIYYDRADMAEFTACDTPEKEIAKLEQVESRILLIQNDVLSIIKTEWPTGFKATVDAVSNALTEPVITSINNDQAKQIQSYGSKWGCCLAAAAATMYTVWTWRDHIPWGWFGK